MVIARQFTSLNYYDEFMAYVTIDGDDAHAYIDGELYEESSYVSMSLGGKSQLGMNILAKLILDPLLMV